MSIMDYGYNGSNRFELNAIDRLDCPQLFESLEAKELMELREPMKLLEPMIPTPLIESIE